MPAEENEALLRRFFEEAVNQRDLSVLGELLAPNYTNHSFHGIEPGPEGMREIIAVFYSAFPDLHVVVDEIFAAGERIASRGTLRGTHRGEFMGLPPTGEQVRFNYTDIWHSSEGKLVETWFLMDMLGMMQQLGIRPLLREGESTR